MPLVINTNVAALNAQRQLVSSGNDMAEAMERLSSGKRINTAADDAAGLAISNRQTSQIRGLTQAIRNANDGVSLIQTAEGALDETTNILQRMRELAIQAANGIYSDTDRGTLDAEFQQLVAELDRIAETTSFNGQKLLDGSLGDVSLQVGANAYQLIDFSIDAMSTSELGLSGTSSDLSGDRLDGAAANNINIGEGDILINGQAISAFSNTQENENLQVLIDDINTNVDGVTAAAFNVAESTGSASGAMSPGDTLTLTSHAIDGGADVVYTLNAIDALNIEDIATAVNDKTGGAINASVSESGTLVLSNTTGASITVNADANTQTATGFALGNTIFHGSLALTSDSGEEVTVTTGANGTDAQLESIGFRRVEAAGVVVSEPLSSVEQSTALSTGDLFINGVAISSTDADNLATKVENINLVRDTTGVTAVAIAQESYVASSDDYQELVFTDAVTTFTAADTILVNGVETGGIADTSMIAVAAAINATANTGVLAYVDSNNDLHIASSGPVTLSDGTGGTVAELGTGLQLDGVTGVAATGVANPLQPLATEAGSVNINNIAVSLTDIGDLDQIVTDINAQQGNTGVRAQIDENGGLQFSANSAITLAVGDTLGLASFSAMGITDGAGAPIDDTDDDGSLADETITIEPRIKLDSTNDAPISIEVTANGATAVGFSNLNTDLSTLVTGNAIANVNVATASAAQSAITPIDNALETINSIRSELGAVNNRLEFTMSNLSNISENTAAARSRIVDADFAAETANLSRAQVLQQASQAMLAQANAQPQQVLQLLQG